MCLNEILISVIKNIFCKLETDSQLGYLQNYVEQKQTKNIIYRAKKHLTYKMNK